MFHGFYNCMEIDIFIQREVKGWRTMAQEFAKVFYNSTAWKRCRSSYIAQRQAMDGGVCETCHEQPGYIVHHKIWLTAENISNADISLNHEHLRYDCLVCHNKESEEEKKVERYMFDEMGQLVSTPP